MPPIQLVAEALCSAGNTIECTSVMCSDNGCWLAFHVRSIRKRRLHSGTLSQAWRSRTW